jgi:hypothetical protein
LFAGGPHNITFVGGQLVLGNARFSEQSCLFVRTSLEINSVGALCPEIVSWVQSVSFDIDTDDRVANAPTLYVVRFYFTTQRVLPVGMNISILLPSRYFVGKSSPAGQLFADSGNAVLSGCYLSERSSPTSSWLQIDCSIDSVALQIGSHSIIFAAGEFATGPATIASVDGLKIKTSSDALSIGVNTPALAGVHNVSIVLASADQYAFQTTTQTVSFFFRTMKPVRASSDITITLPAQYFIGKSTTQ